MIKRFIVRFLLAFIVKLSRSKRKVENGAGVGALEAKLKAQLKKDKWR